MPITPDSRPTMPLAAAVMLGLVLGIFGYILFFAFAFARAADDPLAFVPIVALAPIAGVLARFGPDHGWAIAACVAMPTAFWSLLTFVAVASEGRPAAAHLVAAAMAAACSFAGALVGRAIAARGSKPSV